MIFQTKATSYNHTGSQLGRVELIENRNRPIYEHAIWCVRAGRFVEAARLCSQLIQASTRYGDATHFYAGQFAQRLAGFDETFIFPNDSIVDSASPRSKWMLELNAAMHDFQVKNFTEARIKFANICDSLGTFRNADRYTACSFNWLASSIRLEILTRNQKPGLNTENLKPKWTRIVQQLDKVGDRFQEELPHAHREIAWYYGISGNSSHGVSHSYRAAMRSLRLSVLSAQRMGMAHEEYQTLLSWNAWMNNQDFNVPVMNQKEADRFKELESRQTPASPAPRVNYRTEVSLIECLEEMLSFDKSSSVPDDILAGFDLNNVFGISK
jgi:hypothetical protein